MRLLAATRNTSYEEHLRMDHEHFDTLARRVFTDLRQSRRTALATVFAAALLRRDLSAALAKPTAKRAKAKSGAAGDRCFPGTSCVPGPGKNASRCDYAFSTLFRNRNARGANLSQSNFYNADLTGADLRGANLSGGCFINANLTEAKLGNSVNLDRAIFCRTTMPDGKIDNSGCEGDTPCCHRREQDCRDQHILCFTSDGFTCLAFQGTLGPLGMCWSFGFGCCPCNDQTQDHWAEECNKTFSGCGGNCVAGNEIPFECLSFRNCAA
jgi:hypothetical protein